MTCRVLVVEDEIFVAVEIEHLLTEFGHDAVGIAPDRATAMGLASQAEIALVDLNLRDGLTGPGIGQTLAEEHGVTVVFMTANPAQLGAGVPGTLGVLAKPVDEDELRAAVSYAVSARASSAHRTVPPSRMRLFN